MLSILIIQLCVFLLLYILSETVLHDFYPFDWTAKQFYLGAIIPIVLTTIFGAPVISTSITAGVVLGNVIGHFLGEFLRNRSIATVTPDMDAEMVARLHLHYGWVIWILTVMASAVFGVVLHYVLKYRRERGEKMNPPIIRSG